MCMKLNDQLNDHLTKKQKDFGLSKDNKNRKAKAQMKESIPQV